MFITNGTAITPTNRTALGIRYSGYGAEGRGRPERGGPEEGGRRPAATRADRTPAECVTVEPCLPARAAQSGGPFLPGQWMVVTYWS
jgi:hypothetical protein